MYLMGFFNLKLILHPLYSSKLYKEIPDKKIKEFYINHIVSVIKIWIILIVLPTCLVALYTYSTGNFEYDGSHVTITNTFMAITLLFLELYILINIFSGIYTVCGIMLVLLVGINLGLLDIYKLAMFSMLPALLYGSIVLWIGSIIENQVAHLLVVIFSLYTVLFFSILYFLYGIWVNKNRE